MKKKPPRVQSSTLTLPGQEESSDEILGAVRGVFYESIAEVLRDARSSAYRAVNFVMVDAYWNIGRMIVEEEQQGKERASYGDALIRGLSERLTHDFGRGFRISNLFAFRQFYLAFPIFRTVCGISAASSPAANRPAIRHTVRDELTWSHYRLLIRVENPAAREWYMSEAASQNWSVRALQRQINSLYYERLLMRNFRRNSKDAAGTRCDKTSSREERSRLI
jgi:hypothetical protein